MSDTSFVNKSTVIVADWANDVNRATYGLASLTALRALSAKPTGLVTTYVKNVGEYYYNAADTTSADNGYSIIVSISGARWYIASTGTSIKSFLDYGIDNTGVSDVGAALTALFASFGSNGTTLYPNPGIYRISSTITIANKIRFVGGSMSETFGRSPTVQFLKSSTLSGPAFLLSNGASGTVLEGFELLGEVGNLGDGIVIKGNSITLRNLSVYKMGGDGIRIGADGFGFNCNSWYLDKVVSANNLGYGVLVNDKYDSTLTAAISATTNSLVVSGSFFTAAAVGYSITVKGAGAAGGDLVTRVTGYTSPTQVTLQDNAGTTVTTAVFRCAPDSNAGLGCLVTTVSNSLDGVLLQNTTGNVLTGNLNELNTGAGIRFGQFSNSNSALGGDGGEANGTDLVIDSGAVNPQTFGFLFANSTINSATGQYQTFGQPSTAFTPVLTFGGVAVGMAYTASGEYLRIGDRITGSINFVFTAKGSSTGVAVISGLPVTAASTANPAAPLGLSGNFTGLTGALTAWVNGGARTISLAQNNAGGVVAISDTSFTNTTSFSLNFSYQAAA